MGSRIPLVIILGATGSGKTKLSLDLARKLGGEIIGADSMQIYKGLDIITAKATKEEQSVAPHHMIDILDPQDTFTVIEYRNKTLQIINDLVGKNKLPIVVGGTNYYIESLLWKILIENTDSKLVPKPGILPNNEHELPSEELHNKLKLLDPSMAKRLHPNNKRKILRSLEVLYQKGRKHSEILEEQQSSEGGSKSGGGLRYKDALVLWLRCDQEVLDKRLDARVNSMIEQGLLNELTTFHKLYNEQRMKDDKPVEYTRGIFQSIGFKEFQSYLVLSDEEKETDVGKKTLEEGIEQLKMVTRRYARKQNRWTLNRFLGRTDRQVPPVYGLDTTDPSCWDEKVTVPALQIVRSYMNSEPCNIKPLPVQLVNSVPNSEDETYSCEVCDRVFVGKHQWDQHLVSNRHKKRLHNKHKKIKGDSVVTDYAEKSP